jgi:hypothetical protein
LLAVVTLESIWREGMVAVIRVARLASDGGPLRVTYETDDSGGGETAVAGVDYTHVTGLLTWADYDRTSRYISVPILARAGAQGQRFFTFRIKNATFTELQFGYGPPFYPGLISIPETSVFILDADYTQVAPSAIRVASVAYVVRENGVSLDVKVVRAGNLQGEVQVDYDTVDDTAQAGVHYGAESGTLTWADGVGGEQTVTIDITDNATEDGAVQFFFDLSNPVGPAYIEEDWDRATVVIEDDESDDPGVAGTIALVSAAYAGVAGESVVLSVARTGGSLGAVGVSFRADDGTAVAPNEYTDVSGTLSWANGELGVKTITVPLVDADSNPEPDKTFTVVLHTITGGATLGLATAVVTWQDDDEVSHYARFPFNMTEDRLRDARFPAIMSARRVRGRPFSLMVGAGISTGAGTSVYNNSPNIPTEGTGLVPIDDEALVRRV